MISLLTLNSSDMTGFPQAMRPLLIQTILTIANPIH